MERHRGRGRRQRGDRGLTRAESGYCRECSSTIGHAEHDAMREEGRRWLRHSGEAREGRGRGRGLLRSTLLHDARTAR